jgi:hypothetical protein
VIDAKTYKGRPQLKVEGGFLRPRVQMLLVGGSDCTKFVDGVLRQTETVRAMIGSRTCPFTESSAPLEPTGPSSAARST